MRKFYLTALLTLFLMFGFGLAYVSAQVQNKVVMEEIVPETKITYTENRLIVENLPKDAVLEVFSIVGVKVYSQKIKAGTNEYSLDLPKGYYIIRIGNIVKKISLR